MIGPSLGGDLPRVSTPAAAIRRAAPAQHLELFAPNTTMFPVQTRLAHDELVK